MKVKELDWDSNFFRRKIGKLTIVEDTKELIINGDFELIFVNSKHDINLIIKGYKLSYTENKIVFLKKITAYKEIDENIYSVFKKKIAIDEIYNLAFESGKFSRFKLDEKFKETDFFDFYKKWVDNTYNKTFADELLVYMEDNSVLGFVTYKIFDKHAKIGLIAANIENQGKGIGTKLIEAVEENIYSKGVKELIISTQLINIPAVTFYTKLGYAIKEKVTIKHYWKL